MGAREYDKVSPLKSKGGADLISISVVVTAPHGISDCLLPESFCREADGESLEIIVVDGSESYVDQSRRGLRHLSRSGATIFGLMTAGFAQAQNDWIVLIEDHGRPLPGFLEGYRDAIRDNPEIDLFSGALENVTSTSAWGFANFLMGAHTYWPSARSQPKHASNANLCVRSNAILPREMACDGGVLYLTLQRLIRAGRYMHCENAVVDHVLPLTREEAAAFQFQCAACSTRVRRETVANRSPIIQILRSCVGVLHHGAVKPVRVLLQVRRTKQFGLVMFGRLALLGFFFGLGALAADIRRLRTARRCGGAGSVVQQGDAISPSPVGGDGTGFTRARQR